MPLSLHEDYLQILVGDQWPGAEWTNRPSDVGLVGKFISVGEYYTLAVWFLREGKPVRGYFSKRDATRQVTLQMEGESKALVGEVLETPPVSPTLTLKDEGGLLEREPISDTPEEEGELSPYSLFLLYSQKKIFRPANPETDFCTVCKSVPAYFAVCLPKGERHVCSKRSCVEFGVRCRGEKLETYLF